MRTFATYMAKIPEKAILIGANGLIGQELLKQLIAHSQYQEIIVLVRKLLPLQHEKIKQIIVDFDVIDQYTDLIYGDVIFSCLGSTKKKTPNLKDYQKIDHDYPLNIAKIAFKNGIEQFHLVSAIGADSTSSNFYLQMKGKTEVDLKRIGFKSTYIYQPSLLDGERKEKRPLERFTIKLMRIINPLLTGSLKNYRSIKASTVASAIVNASIINQIGLFIYPTEQIKKIA